MSAAEMTCREFVELVTDYLEDRLPEPERARFDAHVALCPGCDTYLEQMRATLAALGRLPEEPVEPPALDDLLAAFRDWHRER